MLHHLDHVESSLALSEVKPLGQDLEQVFAEA